MKACVRAALLAGVAALASTAGASRLTDLTGWWRVIEDNGHFIRLVQQGVDVTILDGDGTLIAPGVFANDTLWAYPTPADTVILVYHGDTLSGLNEEGNPMTIVRYPVDLNGWWANVDGGREIPRFVHEGSAVQLWMDTDTSTWFVADGTFANDTVLLDLPPELGGALTLIYRADTLGGMGGPDADSIILARSPYGKWMPIRCGTVAIGGDFEDWPYMYLMAQDRRDDGTSTPAAELDRVYLCHDSDYYYFRIECVGDAAFPHSGTLWDRYSIVWYISGTDSTCSIRIESTWEMYFWNNMTQQETMLEPPAVSGRVIEGRIPLELLGRLAEEAEVSVRSAYYDWDFGWLSYDEIQFNAARQACGADPARLTPQPQYAFLSNAVTPVMDTLVIGNLPDRAAGDIRLSSLRVNGAVQPTVCAGHLKCPGFAGSVVTALFPARTFLQGYGLVWDTARAPYTVTGEFRDGAPVNIEGEVTIIGHRSGDVNGDGTASVADVTFLVGYVFRGGRAPQPVELGDVDCDGGITVTDLSSLVAYLLRGGPPPCAR
ncbi:MAG TPA: dockerin type I repeat-containing protein [candidate division Zixibacteria bacterium]|nr:dockerin type I repeat-containing protein [candidate division Zixibacteria bacterium]MDD4916699.1 dockerin type I repeat-containing protein [candidate division Zixibacteria bacterium]MDM7973344.1 dockerin type I repeat-containing protein [candidate division Zixibacteria bacterium]HPM37939.1 dockerin type I repeat-containing protein [candidate division Zixibacteria bacterium]